MNDASDKESKFVQLSPEQQAKVEEFIAVQRRCVVAQKGVFSQEIENSTKEGLAKGLLTGELTLEGIEGLLASEMRIIAQFLEDTDGKGNFMNPAELQSWAERKQREKQKNDITDSPAR